MAASRWRNAGRRSPDGRVRSASFLDIRGPGLVLGGPLLACLLTISSFGPAIAQCPPPGDLSVFVTPGIEIFRVGDFDPEDTRFHPHIFQVTICSAVEQDVVLELVIQRTDPESEQLASGATLPFTLGPGGVTISNRDLTETGSQYELADFSIDPAGEELETQIQALGYLPEGRYCFQLTLYEGTLGGVVLASGQGCITPTNPLNLELLRPGVPFGGGLPLIFSAHPQFQWSSRATRWLIEIAEMEPGDAAGEDVLEHVPVYLEELDAASVFGFGGGAVSWSYPSAAEDLDRGHVYCWRITAHVQTTGGEEDISSEIFCFRRWDAADFAAAPVAEALEAYMDELVKDLGPELEGMVPSGVVLVDGVAVDATELKQLLEDMKSGKLEVLERRIE